MWYCDGKPPPEIMEAFAERADGQITSLEILSIALGEFCAAGQQ